MNYHFNVLASKMKEEKTSLLSAKNMFSASFAALFICYLCLGVVIHLCMDVCFMHVLP